MNDGTATPPGYRLGEDPAELDLDRVHHWLSTDAYWALGRPRDVVARAVAGSSGVAGIYREAPAEGPDGTAAQQVAFARIVSDGATFAWLCDVYVDPAHRGHGLGRWLARWSVEWIAARDIKRAVLATWDAHGVYETAGYRPVAVPSRWMEIDLRPGRPTAEPQPRTVERAP